MNLPLPLHCYDESGAVKPPFWFYVMLAFGARDVMLVLLISAIPSESTTLFSLVFPQKSWLVWQLMGALPFIAVMLLVSVRVQLWKKQFVRWRRSLKPLCWLGLVFQLITVCVFAVRTGGQFNMYYALVIIVLMVTANAMLKSRHLRIMIEDWNYSDTANS